MELLATSNIRNKVRNTRLPFTRPLMPLFEIISNSIHAIAEARMNGIISDSGKINIDIIRNGKPEFLAKEKNVDQYPIKSFKVQDNGIGLNDSNLNSFVEADTDHKLSIGGKGVGRFVCLKAFRELNISSKTKVNEQLKHRKLTFKATKEGFHDFSDINIQKPTTLGTSILLNEYKEEYKKNVPLEILEIAREIITHFNLYFIRGEMPTIMLHNQNGITVDVEKTYKNEFKKLVQEKSFTLLGSEFTVYLTKSFWSLSHKLHFCAHNRSVKNEPLYKKINDLEKFPISEPEGNNYFYQAFVIGSELDLFVNTERIGFDFPIGDDNEDTEENQEITLSKIRTEVISTIEELLSEYLESVRNKKMSLYEPIVHNELPQYKNIWKKKNDIIRKFPPKLTKQKLDFELYKLESGWRTEVKKEGLELLDEKKDITALEDYKERYDKFLSEFNEVGQSDLARYVVHRKSVLDLLDKIIELNDDAKFSDEDIIHSIFFPIRSTSDEIPHEKQNLWLIDERLTYHAFLASDKTFNSVKEISSNSTERTDLLIYNHAFAFSESKSEPFNYFTIVEFKKPMINNYQDYNHKKNPLDQVENYISNLLDGNVKGRNGRTIKVTEGTPFYVYIICDITPSLEKILKKREFDKTPDGMGYFLMKTKYYSAYIERQYPKKCVNKKVA